MFGMNRKKFDIAPRSFIVGLGVVAMIALAVLPTAAFPEDEKQESFSTPEQAVDALIAANRSDSKAELLNILGPQSEELISSGDPVVD